MKRMIIIFKLKLEIVISIILISLEHLEQPTLDLIRHQKIMNLVLQEIGFVKIQMIGVVELVIMTMYP